MEWTIDCGCTTTSMRSYGMPNSRWASISSSPLLISVAELSVTIGPMSHVGWANAAATVTSASSARAPPAERAARCGEHEPVDLVGAGRRAGTGPARSARSRPARSARAPRPPSPARRPRPGTPCWRARAWRPAASAARVGPRPTAPVMPLSTVSTGVVAVSSVAASGPASTSTPGSSSRRARAASSAATATRRTWCARTCSASSATSPPPAASPATVKRSGWRAISSSACVPIEPVEPSTSTDRLPVIASHHPRRVVVRRYGRGEQLP